jgi:hypothetical protein
VLKDFTLLIFGRIFGTFRKCDFFKLGQNFNFRSILIFYFNLVYAAPAQFRFTFWERRSSSRVWNSRYAEGFDDDRFVGKSKLTKWKKLIFIALLILFVFASLQTNKSFVMRLYKRI